MATIVISGANRGIGLELTKQLAERGEHVVALCRRASRELEAVDGVDVQAGVDVAEQAAVDELAERLSGTQIDILINNAGILSQESLDDLDMDRIRRQFEVNTLGPLRLTAALRPALRDGGKVAIVSSRVGSLADNGSGGNYGYRISKAAVNMVGVNLAHDLKPRGIAVVLLHPGYVRTDMTSGAGQVEPADAAAGLIERIDALTLEQTGTFWHAKGEPLPW